MNFKLTTVITCLLLAFSNINATEYNNQLLENNAKVSKIILARINSVLNTENELIKQSDCGLEYRTCGACGFAEQLKLASAYLIKDDPKSTNFKEHAEVFNMCLNILLNNTGITNSSSINNELKAYLNTLIPIVIK